MILTCNIFTLNWDKGKLEQPGGAPQTGFELLSMITDQYQQNEQSEPFIRWEEESHVVIEKTYRQNSKESKLKSLS